MAEMKLIASTCGECAATAYPPTARCPTCGSSEVRSTEMPSSGRILQATTLRVSLPDLQAPYAVSFVRLDSGVKVYCRIAGTDGAPPKPGEPVELVAGEGGEWWGEVRR